MAKRTKDPDCDIGYDCGYSCISREKLCEMIQTKPGSTLLGYVAGVIARQGEQILSASDAANRWIPVEEAQAYLDFMEGRRPPKDTVFPVEKDDPDLEQVWNRLSGNTHTRLKSRGAPAGRTQEGKEFPGTPTERGLEVLRFMLRHSRLTHEKGLVFEDFAGVEKDWSQITIDHKVPLSKGGSDEPSNWIISSIAFNQIKNALDDDEKLRERLRKLADPETNRQIFDSNKKNKQTKADLLQHWRNNYAFVTDDQWAKVIDEAKDPELKEILRARTMNVSRQETLFVDGNRGSTIHPPRGVKIGLLKMLRNIPMTEREKSDFESGISVQEKYIEHQHKNNRHKERQPNREWIIREAAKMVGIPTEYLHQVGL